jgi:hypothetical protein
MAPYCLQYSSIVCLVFFFLPDCPISRPEVSGDDQTHLGADQEKKNIKKTVSYYTWPFSVFYYMPKVCITGSKICVWASAICFFPLKMMDESGEGQTRKKDKKRKRSRQYKKRHKDPLLI